MQSPETMQRQPVSFCSQTNPDPLYFNRLMMVQERYMQENRPHNLQSAWDDDDHPEYYSTPRVDSEYGRENIQPRLEDEVQRENYPAEDNHVEEEESDDDQPQPQPQPLVVLFMMGDEEELANLDGEFIRISEISFLEASERSGQYSNLNEETILKNLRTRQYRTSADRDGDETGDICVVCQSGFEDEEIIAKLGCGHEYHSDCVNRWLQHRNVCPICKRTAIEEDSS
ncbi:E3 ubiquitin-protein ligase BIG BROTHER-like [Coffea eugenioides]|uniref:E3 ubiquitin-protein ligase BIG BROTHER-like n=1 Tax=Coffea eugenioides TaxID=49369 RepID=UPI000F5C82AA|nr:E3 ubiquitin-protein ligase BIG BROTHER-like [Coffea arabica]XP_027152219.1 E3 ubiquitin-protein ligase BIG BROTHER-like [Coffea eugenioides]